MKWMSIPSIVGDELIEAVERRLAGAPVVLGGPVLDDVLDVGEGDALRPVVDQLASGHRVSRSRRRRSSSHRPAMSIENGRTESLMSLMRPTVVVRKFGRDGGAPAGVLRRDQGAFAEERDLRLAYRPPGTAQYTSELDGRAGRLRRSTPTAASSSPARADQRHRRGAVHRRRLLGAADVGPAARGRRREHPHRRAGRRRRRHLVLEPLPRHRLRRRRLRLPAAARRDGLRAVHATTPRARRSSRTARPSPAATTSTSSPCSRPRSPRRCGTRTSSMWHVTHRPRRPR